LKLKVLALVTALCISIGTIGCTNQAAISALVTTLGNATAAVATIEGATDLAAKLKVDTAAASAAVLAWKSGTPAQNIVQALDIVEADLNLFPVGGKYEALIVLAIGTAQSIIEIVNPGAVPVTAKVSASRQIRLSTPPKNAAQLKKQWNAIAVGSLADARIN